MTCKPIVLSKNAIALIRIFTRLDDTADISWADLQPYLQKETSEMAASEFVTQLRGQASIRFFKALQKEIGYLLETYE